MGYALIDESNLTATANAIRTQLGVSDTYTPAEFAPAIASISSGGGGGSEKDVFFIDYDGTLLYSYTADEANALTALPANPSHEGLVAQGWNWTLAEIKSQLTNVGGKVWVGQMYITQSGDTEIDIELTEGRLSPYLGLGIKGTVEIDWGDETAINTVTGTSLTVQKNTNHTYTNTGQYTIKITATSGSYSLLGTNSYGSMLNGNKSGGANYNSMYAKAIKQVRIGNNTMIGSYAFHYCRGLNSITLPNSITKFLSYPFSYCYSLKSIVIPSGITTISDSFIRNGFSLNSIAIPKSVTSIGSYAFEGCNSLNSITMPDNVTTFGSSGSTFSKCYNLTSIVIPSGITSLPSSIFANCTSLTSIILPEDLITIGASAFSYCSSLNSIIIPDKVTSIGNNAFQNCSTLDSVVIPVGLTTVGTNIFASDFSLKHVTISSGTQLIANYMFQYDYNLESIVIPDTITTIGTAAFSGCYSLSSVTVPASVTSILNNAFASCYGVGEFHFLSTSPPTLGGSSVFSIPSDCIIYVPQESLEAYQTAQYWSAHSSKMVGE